MTIFPDYKTAWWAGKKTGFIPTDGIAPCRNFLCPDEVMDGGDGEAGFCDLDIQAFAAARRIARATAGP